MKLPVFCICLIFKVLRLERFSLYAGYIYINFEFNHKKTCQIRRNDRPLIQKKQYINAL